MTYKSLKLASLLSVVLSLTMMESCVKSTKYFTDFSKVSDFVLLMGAGTQNFKAS